MLTAVSAVVAATLSAQQLEDDFGMWYTVAAQKRMSKHWRTGMEVEYRTRDHARTSDQVGITLSMAYHINSNLKAEGGYKWIHDYSGEVYVEADEEGLHPKWTAAHWRQRHRLFLGMEGSVNIGRLNLSLRERWQYTHRHSKDVKHYDFDSEMWQLHTLEGDSKNLLRTRLKAEYDIAQCAVDPQVSAEFFNAWRTEKIRLSAGVGFKLNNQHEVQLFYRYQINRPRNTIDRYNEHIINLGYLFRF